MIGIGFGIIVAVAVGVGASVLITWASGLRPLFAMLVGLVIVLLLAIITMVILGVAA